MSSHNNDSAISVSRTVNALREQVRAWRASGETIALVPTMGALHAGHISLVELANTKADRTVASIFVNPKQFAPHEDLETYPRQEAEDLKKLENAGCDLAFIPNATEMYPPDFATSVQVDAISNCLCGASRPHFFGGVATVVCKLLNQCMPDTAIFGEKDFQQLLIIRRMTMDLDMPVEIIGGPIVREADGLAMSSRNAYLSHEDRKLAGQLNLFMREAIQLVSSGVPVEKAVESTKDQLRNAGYDLVDYLEIRNANSLALKDNGSISSEQLQEYRLFAAAILGQTRLIDNMSLAD